VVTTKQAPAVAKSATVDGVFRERLAAEPDAEFVKCGSQWLTFAQLDDRTDRLAAGLASLGVGRGTMIATILPNRIETVEILLAVAKLGAVQVPLNYWLKGEFLAYQLDDCGASLLIADGPGYAAARDLLSATGITRTLMVDDLPVPDNTVPDNTVPDNTVPHNTGAAPDSVTPYDALFGQRGTFEPVSEASDLVAVMYTSGTTAEAKGCMLSSGYYVSVGRAYGQREWCVPGDRMFTRRRGENISALALETLIRTHPAVADVAVSPVPGPFGDDDIKASIVLADGAAVEPAEFFEFVSERVAYFAVPRYVDIRTALPVNALSRVMKHVLRDEGVTDSMWDLDRLGLVATRKTSTEKQLS